MIGNPFLRLFEAPVEALTALAYALVLVGLLVGTWWALGRNLLYLSANFQAGWRYLVPGEYALRVLAVAVGLAVDCLLLAAIIGVLW